MGNNVSMNLQDDELEAIQTETGFSKNQIVRLYSRFKGLDKSDRGSLGREDFIRIPELAINPLGDRIIASFFRGELVDGDRVNFRQFIRTLARFRPIKKNKPCPLNSREDKLKFAFGMYDVNGNGSVSKEELLVILNMMVGPNITPEQLQSIADRTIQEADKDKDGNISFEGIGGRKACTLGREGSPGSTPPSSKDGNISFEEFCQAMEKTDIEQKMSIRFLH